MHARTHAHMHARTHARTHERTNALHNAADLQPHMLHARRVEQQRQLLTRSLALQREADLGLRPEPSQRA